MIRQSARARREYLYKKTLQDAERDRLDRKIRIREALESGTVLHQSDLEAEAEEQEYGMDYSIDKATKQKKIELELDNEYARAGLEDPKIVLTTARDPSDRLKRFMKELRIVLPNAQRLNRGTQQLKDLVQACIASGFTDFIMVNETRGEPSSLVVSHLPYGPTAHFTIYNTVMRHDTSIQDSISQAYPHLIFHNFKTKLGERVATILKYLFPVPKPDSQRVLTFANDNDFISFRHHVYKKIDGKIHLKEIGPRFELQMYEIRLGTLDMKDAEVEWVLRPYMNSAAKKQLLGKSQEELQEDKDEELNKIRA